MKTKRMMFFCLLTALNVVYTQQLTLSISLEKKEYLKGEPVYVLTELMNNSNENVELTHSYLLPPEFIVNNYNTTKKRTLASMNDIIIEDFNFNIPPVEIYDHIYNLSKASGNQKEELSIGKFFSLGSYRVKMLFHDLLIIDKDTLRNNIIESNTVEFSVVEPGEKDKEVRDKFISLYNDRFKIGLNKFDDELINLINSSKDSPYQNTMAASYFIGWHSDKEKVIELLLAYPNKYWSAYNTGYLIDYNLTDDKAYGSIYKGSLIERLVKSDRMRIKNIKKRD